MTDMPDRDWLELKTERENAQRQADLRHSAERWHRIRSWFFTPRGALVYFGTGYTLLALFFFWWRS